MGIMVNEEYTAKQFELHLLFLQQGEFVESHRPKRKVLPPNGMLFPTISLSKPSTQWRISRESIEVSSRIKSAICLKRSASIGLGRIAQVLVLLQGTGTLKVL